MTCHTLNFHENITKLGIKEIDIEGSNGNLEIFIHQKGSISTEMPGGLDSVFWRSTSLKVLVQHDVVQVLDYNGQMCDLNDSYDLIGCRQDVIFNVR